MSNIRTDDLSYLGEEPGAVIFDHNQPEPADPEPADKGVPQPKPKLPAEEKKPEGKNEEKPSGLGTLHEEDEGITSDDIKREIAREKKAG